MYRPCGSDGSSPPGIITLSEVPYVSYTVPIEYRTVDARRSQYFILWVAFNNNERARPIFFYRGRPSLIGRYDERRHLYVFEQYFDRVPSTAVFVCYAHLPTNPLPKRFATCGDAEYFDDQLGNDVEYMHDYGPVGQQICASVYERRSRANDYETLLEEQMELQEFEAICASYGVNPWNAPPPMQMPLPLPLMMPVMPVMGCGYPGCMNPGCTAFPPPPMFVNPFLPGFADPFFSDLALLSTPFAPQFMMPPFVGYPLGFPPFAPVPLFAPYPLMFPGYAPYVYPQMYQHMAYDDTAGYVNPAYAHRGAEFGYIYESDAAAEYEPSDEEEEMEWATPPPKDDVCDKKDFC